MIRQRAEEKKVYRLMWIKVIPFKINFFLWRLCKQRLPYGESNRRIGIYDDVICCCFNEQVIRTWEYLFLTCDKATRLWQLSSSITHVRGPFVQLMVNIQMVEC